MSRFFVPFRKDSHLADPPSTPAHEITAAAAPPEPLTLGLADSIDLHLHTHASDGAWTPAALVDHLSLIHI